MNREPVKLSSYNNLSLVETRKGNFSLKVTSGDGSIKSLHSLYDPESEARTLIDAFDFDGRGILIVLGCGLGYHVVELAQRYPDTEILVVEGALDILNLAKEYGKVSELGEKVRFLAGLPADKVLREVSVMQLKNGMAPLSLFTLAGAVSVLPAYYNPILSELRKTVSLRLWDRLKYPKFRNDTVKVAIIDFGYFLTLELENAIKQLGHKLVRVPVNEGERGERIVARLMNNILALKPDFFLTVNHLGFDEEGALTSFFESIDMPVASWYVDNPNIIVRAFERNISPYTSLFVWDKGYIKDMESMGFESVEYLPLAADEKVFRPMRLSVKDQKRFGSEVGFVGNSSVESFEEAISGIERRLRPLVDKMAKKGAASRKSFNHLISTLSNGDRRLLEGLRPKEKMDMEKAVVRKATLLYRLSCIGALGDFGAAIHGDNGWRRLLNSKFRLYHSLNYYRELPLFYNACNINFNATSLQMGEAVNQRVFDVPACGSFLLTDNQKDLEDLFDIGKEVVRYSNIDEIPELVKFYLKNKASREAIARRGRERVLKEHTYKHRLDTIIHSMKKRYS